MAIIYFTNNASTGAGSLVEAIKNASPGDVIRPDESVFERGSIIEIAPASTLIIDKTLTLDGGPYRVRLNGGGAIRCARVSGGDGVKFAAFDFVNGAPSAGDGGCVSASVPLTLERCGFYGGVGDYGGGVFARSTLTLNDCVVTGCRAKTAGGGVAALNGLTLRGTTIVGNVSANANSDAVRHEGGDLSATNSIVGPVRATGGGAFSYPGSVVDVASSQIGFVVAPQDDFSVDNWTANAWQNWDLRLLDDASGAPSPYRDSGDIDKMTQYDFQGNFRGREANGAATCSPGAYETIQGDLFWVGRDANGAEVVSPSWINANGWAASRFATASGDIAPQGNDVVFVDGDVVFEAATLRLKKLIVGGAATLGFNNPGSTSLTLSADSFDIGVGATTRGVSGTQRLQIVNATLRSRFADDINIGNMFFFNTAENLQIAPTSRFTSAVSNVKLYKNGVYTNYNLQIVNAATIEDGSTGCNNLYISFQNSTARLAAVGTPRVSVNVIRWTTPSDATNDFSALTSGSSPIVFAPRRSATVVGNGSRDDFLIDVSNAQPSGTLSLTLTGQTVYGNALKSTIELTGDATVGKNNACLQEINLNSESCLTIDNGNVNVETLNSSNSTINFVGTDSILCVTSNAFFVDTILTGQGYFTPPDKTSLSGATIDSSIRIWEYGAGVQTFSVTIKSSSLVEIYWTQTNESCPVILERYNKTWEPILEGSLIEDVPIEIALNSYRKYRIFDGEKFLYDSIKVAAKSFYVYSISSTLKDVETLALYSKKTQVVRAHMEGTRNENILLLAQIKNLLTGEFLSSANIDSITASVYKINKSISSNDIWEEQEGWSKVDVDKETLIDVPVMIEGWTNDDVGANFIWTPDTRNKNLFKEGGRYIIQVTFNLIDDNPVIVSFNINVK